MTGGKSYFLKGERAPRTNVQVRVSGDIDGNQFQATSVTPVGHAGGSVTPTGTTNVLVMLVDWTSPDAVTQASATTQMFTDTNGYYRDASFGGLGQTGAVTPWLKIAGPSIDANGNPRCYGDFGLIMDQAQSAATAAGYTLSSYNNLRRLLPALRGRLRRLLGLGLRRLDRHLAQRLPGPASDGARAGPQLWPLAQPLLPVLGRWPQRIVLLLRLRRLLRRHGLLVLRRALQRLAEDPAGLDDRANGRPDGRRHHDPGSDGG